MLLTATTTTDHGFTLSLLALCCSAVASLTAGVAWADSSGAGVAVAISWGAGGGGSRISNIKIYD